ncbi:type I-F CRISPR-associated protein Cas7f/Csy3 [Endozoicomonas gorgoniicola]|uniref:Type I-F CRISPR-associated protein Cas7f/Csy3 n=1 Tax=Endozoicomonas gorgoniicola TaxID=1234144 RepID=A0ABT3N421_9GAMM|nr:type I-F CRISPR-associated protein Cas7f/Csy3 [Endozoicomonas gorgoniicola]MCW7556380.1 type I-F CRISPR-associated protein Cas7f/Csy3 [Endozoicomonas gorgoniicola]
MASPNQLNFERSLEIGCGYLYSRCSETGRNWTLHVQPPRNFKGPPGDFASLSGSNEQNLDTPNIHRSEFIRNEPGDTLRVVFEGIILNNAFSPKTSDLSAKQELLELLDTYRDKGGFEQLARLILCSLLNFRWLRRNNKTYQFRRQLTFKTHHFKHIFTLPDWLELPNLADIKLSSPDAIQECIEFIATCLYKPNVDRWFKVYAELYTGRGLNIFPSQEMHIDKKNNDADKKHSEGRTFLKGIDPETGRRNIPLLDERHILYALYTFDSSYAEEESLELINVNPSGFVEIEGKHYRDYRLGNCIFNYQERLKSLTKELQEINDPAKIPNKMHYVVGCYTKGGLFGQKNE